VKFHDPSHHGPIIGDREPDPVSPHGFQLDMGGIWPCWVRWVRAAWVGVFRGKTDAFRQGLWKGEPEHDAGALESLRLGSDLKAEARAEASVNQAASYDSDLHKAAVDAFLRVNLGFERIRDAGVRSEGRRGELETALAQATDLLNGGRFYEAIQMLEPLVGELSGEDKTKARVMLGTAYTQNPKWMHRGEEVFRAVLLEDPRNTDALLRLATIYNNARLASRARALLRQAGFDPDEGGGGGSNGSGGAPAPVYAGVANAPTKKRTES
jgi:hypothetical protein